MSVPVKSFKQLLTSIARRCGMLEEDGSVKAEVSGDLTDLINSAMRAGWQAFAWPDALAITEEDVITHPTVAGARYVPRQTAARTMTSVLKVWNKDPRQNSDAVDNVARKIFADGVYVYDANLSTVWCCYRPAAPEYSDEAWNAESEYAAGDLVLHTNGHVYRSLQAENTNQAPNTETEWWVMVPVLQCLFEPVKNGVLAYRKRYQSEQPVTAKDFALLMQADLENEIETIRNEEN